MCLFKISIQSTDYHNDGYEESFLPECDDVQVQRSSDRN